MPFIEQVHEGGEWSRKDRVAITQVRTGGSKTYFEFIENFAYTTEGARRSPWSEEVSPERFVEPLFDMVVRKSPDQFGPRIAWRSDLATVPKSLWGIVPSYGKHTIVAIMHDALCDQSKEYLTGRTTETHAHATALPGKGRRLRRRADNLFRIALADVGGKLFATRWLMWSAVRLFGFLPLGLTAIALSGLLTAMGVLAIRGAASPPWLLPVVGAVTLILLVMTIALSREHKGEWQLDMEGENRSFSAPAWGSIIGAAIIAVLSVPVIAPVVLITVFTSIILLILDIAAEAIAVATRFFLPRPAIQVVPPGPHGDDRTTSSGDT